jgi:hypothetical protein
MNIFESRNFANKLNTMYDKDPQNLSFGGNNKSKQNISDIKMKKKMKMMILILIFMTKKEIYQMS